MEKRFSLETIISSVVATVKRFPFPIIVATLATVAALTLFNNEDSVTSAKLLLTFALIFPLSVGVTALGEHCTRKTKLLLLLAVTLFAALYYFFLAKNIFIHEQGKYYIQYLFWALASVIFATFVPFLKQQTIKSLDFWFYNQRIVYAFLATFIYSAVLFIGLTVAMTSFSFLFDIDLGVNPFQLWIVVVGIFCPIFFLSRYPTIQDDSLTVYPNEIKKFSYYILAPLVALYFLILYSYTIKIVALWEWPKGIISYMILGFSTLGILTYVVLHPLITKEARLQKIARMFFAVLLPQVAVLLWAVWMRIAEYGVTENRYLLVVFGFWLLGIALYFLFSTRKNISTISVSLFTVLILVSVGPWSMFSISENSQVNRLQTILERNGVFVDGKVVKDTKGVASSDAKEIASIVMYLDQRQALGDVESWFKEGVDVKEILVGDVIEVPVIGKDEVPSNALDLKSNMGDYYSFDVRGYDYIATMGGQGTDTTVAGNRYRFELDRENLDYLVYINGKQVVKISKKEYFSNLLTKYGGKSMEIPAEELSFTYENGAIKMKVYFEFALGSIPRIHVNQVVLFSVQ